MDHVPETRESNELTLAYLCLLEFAASYRANEVYAQFVQQVAI